MRQHRVAVCVLGLEVADDLRILARVVAQPVVLVDAVTLGERTTWLLTVATGGDGMEAESGMAGFPGPARFVQALPISALAHTAASAQGGRVRVEGSMLENRMTAVRADFAEQAREPRATAIGRGHGGSLKRTSASRAFYREPPTPDEDPVQVLLYEFQAFLPANPLYPATISSTESDRLPAAVDRSQIRRRCRHRRR